MERGFWTPLPKRRTNMCSPLVTPASEKKWKSPPNEANNDFHVIHKVPTGDSPYCRAKHVQLVDKNPSRAISMFWAAINSGDRVDSALKDMAVVMKQLNRSDEAIEAIKSFRHLCPFESQQSLDNILVELYKRSGRLEEQIELLQSKLKQIEEGLAFSGKQRKLARSQGKKIQITIEEEYSRLLGNLAWAYLQQDNYKLADEFYRKALSLESDKNKQCNLAICLMYTNRITEARFLLQSVVSSSGNRQMDDSYSKSYKRAIMVLDEVESEQRKGCIQTPFSSILSRRPANEYDKDDYISSGKDSSKCHTFGARTTSESSPFPTRGIPKVPFTQPRTDSWSYNRRDQGRAGFGCNRNLSFEPLVKERFSLSTSGDWRKTSFVDHGKLQSESVGNGRWKRNTWENDKQEKVTKEGREAVSNITMSEDVKLTNGIEKTDFVKSKKSWADMVDEDEQKLLSGMISPGYSPSQDSFCSLQTPRNCWNCEEYDDENMDSNIICKAPLQLTENETLSKKMESLNLKNGYCTQPGIASVKRSLCFDQHQKPCGGDINGCSSPLQKKTLDFENYDSAALVKEEGCNSSSGRRRTRLQVFRDITLLSETLP